jgi:hypothetical protein
MDHRGGAPRPDPEAKNITFANGTGELLLEQRALTNERKNGL